MKGGEVLNKKGEVDLRYTAEDEVISRASAEELVARLTATQKKEAEHDLALSCSFNQTTYYPQRNALLTCTTRAAKTLSDVRLCVLDQCKSLTLQPGSSTTTFSLRTDTLSGRLTITADTPTGVAYTQALLNVIAVPVFYTVEYPLDKNLYPLVGASSIWFIKVSS